VGRSARSRADRIGDTLRRVAWVAAWLFVPATIAVLGYLSWTERGTHAAAGEGRSLQVTVRAGASYDILQRSSTTVELPVACQVSGRELPVVLRTDGPRKRGERISRGESGEEYYVGYLTAEDDGRLRVSCPLRSAWSVEPQDTTQARTRRYLLYAVGLSPLVLAGALVGAAAALDRSARRRSRAG
jgi:hypothetical protein